MTPEGLPALDPAVLENISLQLGSRMAATKLMEIFSSTSSQYLVRITSSLASRDFKAASSSAHALKGGALTIGLTRLAHVCAHLERRLGMEDAAVAVGDPECAMLGLDLARECDQALESLARWSDSTHFRQG